MAPTRKKKTYMNKDKAIGFRVDEKTYNWVMKQAEREGSTAATIVRRAVKNEMATSR